MKDIPVFTTENGVASLVLREVPYKGVAFITLQDSLQPEKLLKECADFCRAVGAKQIFATGYSALGQYNESVIIYQMKRDVAGLTKTSADLIPVTEKTLDRFRDFYNKKMAGILTAATMTQDDARQLLLKSAGYFIYQEDVFLGIGIVEGNTVKAIAGAYPGAGTDVLLALCTAITSETVLLEVASNNKPALRLYKKAGFCISAELLCWYDVKNIC